MKERPILMNYAMVSATLAGHKTQTRRIVKPQPFDGFPHKGSIDFDGFLPHEDIAQWSAEAVGGGAFKTETQECPYGTVGDRLYVREAFYAYGRWQTRYSAKKKRDEWHFVDMTVECDRLYQYDTQHITPEIGRGGVTPAWHKRQSLFMPRRASRILLEISGVRVERLQDISEEDALTEGIEKNWTGDPAVGPNGFGGQGWVPDCGWINYMEDMDGDPAYTPQDSFRSLWQSINGRDSWDANPWVWVVEFRRIES